MDSGVEAATVKQSIFGLGHMDYTAPDSALIGSGEQASILIVPGYREVPQLLNVRTGELTNLGDPDDDTISYDLVQASDGVIVEPWLKTKYAYDSVGGIRGDLQPKPVRHAAHARWRSSDAGAAQ